MSSVWVIAYKMSEYDAWVLQPHFGAFTSKEDAEWLIQKAPAWATFYQPMELTIASTE
jgi:hypothetical protein